MSNYRSRKLLDTARDAPHCMRCFRHNCGDVVMAHANWHEYGKGGAIKAHDWAVAALCGTCHMEIDQGKALSKDERKEEWRRAHVRTLEWLFDTGRLAA